MIALVRLPDLHKVAQNLISCLAARLEIRVEAHIISHPNIIDGDLAATIFVKNGIRLMHHVQSARIKAPSDSSNEFIEGQLAVFVRIKVLDNLSDLDFTQVETIVAHGVLELNW